MEQDIFAFGEPSLLTAGAVGEPGQRTFYIIVGEEKDWVRIWLEKEQLRALGIAIEQVLAEQRPPGVPVAEAAELPAAPPSLPEPPIAEFHVGALSLAYDEARGLIILLIHDQEVDPQGPPTFACQATLRQAKALSRRIAAVVTAGRPVCPLCNRPIDASGHICPRSNGHDT